MSTLAMSTFTPTVASRSKKFTIRQMKHVIKGISASGIPRSDAIRFAVDFPDAAEIVNNYWRNDTDYNMRGFLWGIGLGRLRNFTRATRKVYRKVRSTDRQLAPYAAMMFSLGFDYTKMTGLDGARVIDLWAHSVEFEDAISYATQDLDDAIINALGVVFSRRRKHILLEQVWA